MKTRLLVLISLIFSVMSYWSAASAQDAGKRIALVIGNAKYPDADSPLKEPIADMRAMADELKHSGFEVAQGENLGREAMQKAIDGLYGRIKPGSVVMVFFSGYGIQSGRQTFMIPVDGQLWTEADVRRDGFSLDNMLERDQQPRRRRQDCDPRCVAAQSVRAALPQLFRRACARDRAARVAGDVLGGAGQRRRRCHRRSQSVRQRTAQGDSRPRPHGGRGAQPHAQGRVACLPRRPGAVVLVVAGGGILVRPGSGGKRGDNDAKTSSQSEPAAATGAIVGFQGRVARPATRREADADRTDNSGLAQADDTDALADRRKHDADATASHNTAGDNATGHDSAGDRPHRFRRRSRYSSRIPSLRPCRTTPRSAI